MTEADWFRARRPQPLLDFVGGRLTVRKLRLIGCGCCRVAWPATVVPECWTALDAAERVADRVATADDEREGSRAASYVFNLSTGTASWVPRRYKQRPSKPAAWAIYSQMTLGPVEEWDRRDPVVWAVREVLDWLNEIDRRPAARRLLLAQVIRDVAGNPFRPVAFDPDWRTGAAVALARGMYEAKEFAHLPVLADALEDAGCTDAAVLAHCRGPGPHVRGC